MNEITFPLSLPISINYRLFLNLKFFLGLALTLIFALLIFYIFQINSLSHQIYLSQNYEKRLLEIGRENENLKISLVRINSLNELEKYLQAQNFKKISPEQIKYIQILESEMVVK